MHDELLDLVDENDVVIGTVLRSKYDELLVSKQGYIRAVEIFILNDQGQIWVPKRTATKRIAPNGLDFSVAGHVDSGESYMDSALRETAEEVNLNLTEADLEFVATIGPDQNRYIRKLYIYRTNQTPDYNPDDFVGAEWMTPAEFLQALHSGVPAKVSLEEAVLRLQEWLTNNQ